MTRRTDGEWRAVDARGIFRAQRLAREIYEAELGKELCGLGYEVKTYSDGRAGRDRAVGIAGFEPEHLRHSSKRSREIEKALQSQGLKSRLHGSRVTVATRAAKPKGVDREALLWNWRTTVLEMSLQFPEVGEGAPGDAYPAGPGPGAGAFGAGGGQRRRRASLRATGGFFPLAELEKEALSRGRDRGVTIDDVRKDIFTRDDLVVADRSDAMVARVTTSQAFDDERALLQAVERGRGRGFILPGPEGAGGLGEDQLKVPRHILGSPDRLLAVEGN